MKILLNARIPLFHETLLLSQYIYPHAFGTEYPCNVMQHVSSMLRRFH
jgi:hypothetical protein